MNDHDEYRIEAALEVGEHWPVVVTGGAPAGAPMTEPLNPPADRQAAEPAPPFNIRKATDCYCVPGHACDCTDARVQAAEMTATFNLRWKADMRAIKRWQKEHPGNELTWPDHADLVVWLMGELSKRRAAALAARLRKSR